MPFQSEKQRRYMHANLPRIAKRWERDYANGGIASQGGMKNYLGEQPMVNAPKYWQSAPDHEMTELAYITPREKDVLVNMDMYGTMNGSPNEGPSGIMSLNGWGDKEQGFGMSDTGQGLSGTGGHSYGDKERYKSVDVQGPPNIHGGTTRTIGPTTPKDTFKQSWSGQPGFLGFGGGYRNLKTPGFTPERGGAYQSRFGLGSLLRGAMSMFGGIPGKIGSMLSRINPGKLRGWNEQYGRYNTQAEYEQARQNRINEKRMSYLSDRKSKGLGYGKKAYADLLGQGYSDPFQDAINRDLQINPETTQFAKSHLQSLANKQALTNQLSAPKRSLGQIVMDARKKNPVNLDPGWSAHRNMTHANAPQSIKDFYTNSFKSRYDDQGLASLGDPWAGPEFQQVGWNTTQKGMVESLKDLGFSAKDAYEKLSNKNKSKGLVFKDYPDPLQPEEFYDKWYGGSFDQLPSNKKGYEVPQDIETQIQNIYKDYI